MNIYIFWIDFLEQNADNIRENFTENAYINWQCTNEHFNVDEFIIANCEYPGNWNGEVDHVTSFIKVIDDKIAAADEYWADDGIAPKWRLDKQIGKAIK